VAPTLRTALLAETWIRDPPLPSFCPPQYKWQVLNVAHVFVSDDAAWSETDDHSKVCSPCHLASRW
jgi:hypothetical protein